MKENVFNTMLNNTNSENPCHACTNDRLVLFLSLSCRNFGTLATSVMVRFLVMVNSVFFIVMLQRDIDRRNVQRPDRQMNPDIHLIKHRHAQQIK
jgi:hypothetical protein